MKIRKLVVCAAAAMAASCFGVYLAVPAAEAGASWAPRDEPNLVTATPITATAVEEAASLQLDARVGHATLAADGDRTTFVLVEMRGEAGRSSTTLATSTALVIDTSGSMAGARIARAEEAARRWVERAPDGESITVIGFAGQAREIVPPTTLSAANRATVAAQLTGIAAAGDTCLSCGVDRALAALNAANRVQRVVVLSDGQANTGVITEAGMHAVAQRCRDRNISLSTIGLGTSYNEKVLARLAFDANGLHHFVDQPSDLPAVFEREETTLRNTVASGVTAAIDLAPGVELVRVFARKFRQDGQHLSVDIGPVASGAARTVLLEVRVPARLGAAPVATATVAFRDTVSDRDRALSRELSTHVGDTLAALDDLVAMRLERAQTADTVEQASALFEAGRQGEAVRLLDARVSRLKPRAELLPRQAHQRGDVRAKDIQDDMSHQLDTTERARDRFREARPKAPSGLRAVKATAIDPYNASL